MKIDGISCSEIGLFALQGGARVQQLGQLEYSVGGTWQLEVLRGGAWPLKGLKGLPCMVFISFLLCFCFVLRQGLTV